MSDITKEIVETTEKVDNLNLSTQVSRNNKNLTSPEKVIKHPLQNAWTLWFFRNDKSRTWDENQRAIITVSTVEDFWALYNHIEVPSKIPVGSDYSLFKEGIFPDWDDKRNKPGGRLMINLDKRHGQEGTWTRGDCKRGDCLDSHWLEVMFFLIGEHADDHAPLVNGAVVNVRNKGDKLAVWLADADQETAVVSIGKMLKKRLELPTIGFIVHEEEKKRTGLAVGKPSLII